MLSLLPREYASSVNFLAARWGSCKHTKWLQILHKLYSAFPATFAVGQPEHHITDFATHSLHAHCIPPCLHIPAARVTHIRAQPIPSIMMAITDGQTLASVLGLLTMKIFTLVLVKGYQPVMHSHTLMSLMSWAASWLVKTSHRPSLARMSASSCDDSCCS